MKLEMDHTMGIEHERFQKWVAKGGVSVVGSRTDCHLAARRLWSMFVRSPLKFDRFQKDKWRQLALSAFVRD